jgi:hypothetical protein
MTGRVILILLAALLGVAAGLANPDILVEKDAVAVVPLRAPPQLAASKGTTRPPVGGHPRASW